MMSLGYDEVARVCLTHSFNVKTIDVYVGNFDTTEEETELIKTELAKTNFEPYPMLQYAEVKTNT